MSGPVTIIPDHTLDYLDERGAPDLQRLVRIFGGHHRIPQWAWDRWDADNAEYQKRRRLRPVAESNSTSTTVTVAVPKVYLASDECHCCHQYGALGFRAKTLKQMGVAVPDESGDDDLFWFCDRHKPAAHFTDARRP